MDRTLVPSLITGLALVGLPIGAADPPPSTPQIPVGKDTTYLTEPLDKDGGVDYVTAVNTELSGGVTPENNATVLLIRAFGPAPDGRPLPPAYFRWLGIDPPPRDGNYLRDIGRFARDRFAQEPDQVEALLKDWDRARQSPWSPRDLHPGVAAWLEASQPMLDRVAEAARRPRYYNPLVPTPDNSGPGRLGGTLLPGIGPLRGSVQGLLVRAMRRLHERQFDAAWADILAAHRLARHLSHGSTLIEYLTGASLHAMSCAATLTYLEAARPDARQAQARLKELQDLPRFRPVADLVDRGERLFGLDTIQGMARNAQKIPKGLEKAFDTGQTDAEVLEQAAGKINHDLDWAVVLRVANREYDRLAAAARLPTRAERVTAFSRLEDEAAASNKAPFDEDKLRQLVRQNKQDELRQEVSRVVGEVLMRTLRPAVGRCRSVQDRLEQTERNLHVAWALAAYHADHKRYPARLADLVPHYLPAVPEDLFSGRPLVYRPQKDGYVLYSVGDNGQDDGGRAQGEEPNGGDDLVIRMPRRTN